MITAVAGGNAAPRPQPTMPVPNSTSAGVLSAESSSSGTNPTVAVSSPASRTPRGSCLAASRPLSAAKQPSPRPNGATSRPEASAEPSCT